MLLFKKYVFFFNIKRSDEWLIDQNMVLIMGIRYVDGSLIYENVYPFGF